MRTDKALRFEGNCLVKKGFARIKQANGDLPKKRKVKKKAVKKLHKRVKKTVCKNSNKKKR
jgi:hypothetical protein